MGRLRRSHARLIARDIQKQKRRALRRAALRAGTAAVFAVSTGMISQKRAFAEEPTDPHCLAVPGDTDGDGLADWEEKVIGYNPANADEDGDSTADGAELAKRCAAVIRSLPIVQPGEPARETMYAVELLMDGVEQCLICGATVNMGSLEVHNPALGAIEYIQFIRLHYLEHGSFSYAGTVHENRVSVPSLVRVLGVETPNQGNHQVAVDGDSDGDLLSDREEYGLGFKPFEADQNGTGTADGADLARSLSARIENHTAFGPDHEVHESQVFGIEQCHICGQTFNMGGISILNTRIGLRYPQNESERLPYVALHSMSHGSLDYFGEVHRGRVDINLLMRVLNMQAPYPSDQHDWPLFEGDTDNDRLSDAEEIAAKFNPHDADQNDNLALDGVDLARQCKRAIDALPVYETAPAEPEGPYKIDRFQRGIEVCEVCGESVNMGFWEVHNPTLGLSMEVPDIMCHFLGHGCLGYAGGVHGVGRIEVNKLLSILEMPRECGDLGAVHRAGDLNRDCRVDLKDLAELAGEWLTETQP